MISIKYLVISGLTLFSLFAQQVDDKSGDYFKDGLFTARLEVLSLQGGVVGYTGTYYTIEMDGSWSSGQYLKKKLDPEARGRLKDSQMAQLAKELARYDLAGLQNHGQSHVNPHLLVIHFGENKITLFPERGDSSQAEDEAIRARYQGIAKAVSRLCNK